MNRIVLRLVLAGVGFVVVLGIKFSHRGTAGDNYRKLAHKIVAKVDGYGQKPDYYDWLVDAAHDHCFNDAYHMDFSRRQDHSWVDDDQYMENLFAWMVDEANNDKAPQVAEALSKYRSEHVRSEHGPSK